MGRVSPERDLEQRARHPLQIFVVVAAVGRGEDTAEEGLEAGRVLQLVRQRPSRQDVIDDDVEVVENLGTG